MAERHRARNRNVVRRGGDDAGTAERCRGGLRRLRFAPLGRGDRIGDRERTAALVMRRGLAGGSRVERRLATGDAIGDAVAQHAPRGRQAETGGDLADRDQHGDQGDREHQGQHQQFDRHCWRRNVLVPQIEHGGEPRLEQCEFHPHHDRGGKRAERCADETAHPALEQSARAVEQQEDDEQRPKREQQSGNQPDAREARDRAGQEQGARAAQ